MSEIFSRRYYVWKNTCILFIDIYILRNPVIGGYFAIWYLLLPTVMVTIKYFLDINILIVN